MTFPLTDVSTIDSFKNFSKEYEVTLNANRARLSFFLNLISQFKNIGIPVLPLKGLDLLIRAYPTIGMRPMADIDLLIQKKDAQKVMTYFDQLGFKRVPDEGLTYLSVDLTINLDIIWDFWYFTRSEDRQAIWGNTVSRTLDGTEVRALHPEDDFIYLTAYTAAHRGVLSETLIRDLDAFLEKEAASIIWERLAQKIKKLKLKTPIYHALIYAKKSGLSKIPDGFINQLRPISASEKISYFLLNRLVTEEPQPKISYFFTWLGYPGIRGKLKLLREKLLPSPFELNIQRGVRGKPGYFAWIIFHPWIIIGRTLKHLFCHLFRIKVS